MQNRLREREVLIGFLLDLLGKLIEDTESTIPGIPICRKQSNIRAWSLSPQNKHENQIKVSIFDWQTCWDDQYLLLRPKNKGLSVEEQISNKLSTSHDCWFNSLVGFHINKSSSLLNLNKNKKRGRREPRDFDGKRVLLSRTSVGINIEFPNLGRKKRRTK